MDIKSGKKYPASTLSNFAPHPFEIDGVKCNSMEGWLQSLKFKNPEMQEEVCKLVGYAAKKKGRNHKWDRKLYWRGIPVDRFSNDYQELLNRAYKALGKNKKFKKALLATGDASLTHSIGKRKEEETILTQREFCSRLVMLRERFIKAEEEYKETIK